MNRMASIYKVRNLIHAYEERPVLKIESFSIAPAAIVGLIGPNGSGKSTLLKLLSFIEKPSGGQIFFKGNAAGPFSQAIRFQVTLLTQEPYLLKRTVYENIAYGLRLRGNGRHGKERIFRALKRVGLDGEYFANRRWYELSGGEAQRVALAARLVLKPEVLLMDEPTASVDAASAQLIKDAALRARQQWGTTLVVASHDWPWLYEICDEVRHLFRGQFFEAGEENFVFGPWLPREDALYQKKLPDGQFFVVPRPIFPKAAAVIPANAIRIQTEKSDLRTTFGNLNGVISRQIHEKRTGLIVVTVLAGNLPFTLKVTREDLQRFDLYPGREVIMEYDPEQIKWSNG